MRFNYCPTCGHKLTYKYIDCEGDIPYCSKCCKLHFPHSEACVIILVRYNDKIVLIQQDYISKNYVCVAGHIKETSNAEETVIEEVKEEIGLDVLNTQYINSYYYPKGNKLMLGYYVEATGHINTNDEVDKYIVVDSSDAGILLKDSSIALKLYNDCKNKNII